MDKRFWVCGVVVSMAALMLGFVVHGVLLRAEYLALASLYRDQAGADARFGWILLAYALLGFAMTWLYRRMHDDREFELATGLRFGLAVAMVSYLPWHLLAYVALPLPAALLLRQLAGDIASMLLLGMLLAWLRPRRRVLTPAPAR